ANDCPTRTAVQQTCRALILPITLPAPRAPLFPYTTLFRSAVTTAVASTARVCDAPDEIHASISLTSLEDNGLLFAAGMKSSSSRSEEHTSELQSHLNLVCRLLLEKKKQTNDADRHRPDGRA